MSDKPEPNNTPAEPPTSEAEAVADTQPHAPVDGETTPDYAAGDPTTDADGAGDDLAAAQAKADEYLEGWQRARAEFANYKKRTDRELQEAYQHAKVDALVKLLPIIDDIERAMSNLPDDLQGHSWLDGIALIERKFQKLLDEQEIETIDPVGEPFDPNLHQAIGTEPSDEFESDHVTETLQKGYKTSERVLRPALVKVAQ